MTPNAVPRSEGMNVRPAGRRPFRGSAAEPRGREIGSNAISVGTSRIAAAPRDTNSTPRRPYRRAVRAMRQFLSLESTAMLAGEMDPGPRRDHGVR